MADIEKIEAITKKVKKLNTKHIKKVLKKEGIDTGGTRDVLVDRLIKIWTEQANEQVESSEEESDNNDNNCRNVQFSFNDVESSLKKFSGDDHSSIEKWISDFEEQADIVGWNDLQKLVYGKRCLIGTAQLAAQVESPKSWETLKAVLLSEFKTKLNSAEIHRLLSNSVKKRDETYLAYVLRVKEIASAAAVDDKALIQYLITGIPDRNENKIMLYGAETLPDFKEKLKIYEEFKSNSKNRYTTNIEPKPQPVENIPRCRHCNRLNHTENECRQKSMICYKCNQIGHKSRFCPQAIPSQQIQQPTEHRNNSFYQQQPPRAPFQQPIRTTEFRNTNLCQQQPTAPILTPDVSSSNFCNEKYNNSMMKEISINGQNINVLIDTGSELNLIREDTLKSLNIAQIPFPSTVMLSGIGNNTVKTTGSIEIDIEIDGNSYNIIAHIVSKHVMPIRMILGNEFLQTVILKIESNKIEITQKIILHEETNFIMNIRYISKEDDMHAEEVQQLITNYTPNENIETTIETKIVLSDDIPVFQNPRPISIAEKKVVEHTINEWLQMGIISPSTSNYASPIVLAKKKDDSLRLCIDYRRLNKKIIMDRYPMPNVEHQIDQLHSAKIYSILDLENGFFHVPVEKNSRKFTAFNCHMGIFEFNRTPFGLSLSPSSFMRYINHVFRNLINKGIVLIYVDDLIIPSTDVKEGLWRLKQVLQVSAENGLKIKWQKCSFLQTKVEYLGYIIQNGTIEPTPKKIAAVVNYPEPKSAHEIQVFLGLAAFCRKFIPDYGRVSAPLSDLLKKDRQFQFSELEKNSFFTLKQLLTTEPVILNLFKPGLHTEIHTDASKEGLAGILLQKSETDQLLHPISYMSRKTTPAEKKFHSYELETLAVVSTIKKFRVYLHGNQFKIVTDCKALTQTLHKKEIPARVARWAMFLQDYAYTIEHRSANRMKHVDSLSRFPVMFSNLNVTTYRIKDAQKTDGRVSDIIQNINKQQNGEYSMSNDILYRFSNGRYLLVVPDLIASNIIRHVHETNGHFRSDKLETIIKREYDIRYLNEKIKNVVDNCVACLIADRKRGKIDGLLHPIPKDDQPLQTIHADHLGPMTKTDKMYEYVFAIIDSFSKYCWLYPTKTTSTKEVIDKMLLHQQNFGNPLRLITDKGSAFLSNEFKAYCTENNIELITITTGTPRGNGQIERQNACIISILTKLAVNDPKKWYRQVPHVQMVLNSTYQRAIKTTPFEILIGTTMRRPEDLKILELLNDEMKEEFIENRNEKRKKAKIQISKIQEENRRTYNKKARHAPTYTVDDIVFIKRTQFGSGLKLKGHFLGPYRVTKVLPCDRYEVIKISDTEGPKQTSVSADNMKMYQPMLSETDNL